jgi:cytidylate kinase
MIVTVDGPGGSGKSTCSRILARKLGVPYLNSGFIYRAVTVLVQEAGAPFEDHEAVAAIIRGMRLNFQEDGDHTRLLAGDRDLTPRLKAPDVTPNVYRIANDAFYRGLLVDVQRRAAEPGGVVAEGRDMGTVIFPQAEHKFYLDASPEERARRQHRDLQEAGHSKSYAEVLSEVIARDRHDREREIAPLCVPPGAVVIVTDSLGVREVVEKMLEKIGPAAAGHGRST